MTYARWQVRYTPTGQTFTAANLEVSVQLNRETVTWVPEPAVTASLRGNLLGTIRVSWICSMNPHVTTIQ